MPNVTFPPFVPAWWAPGPHAQTILGRYWGRHMTLPTDQRHEIPVSDGDRVVVLLREGKRPELPVVYLFHGLGGSTDSDYIPRTATVLVQAGYTVVMGNHRGCGPGAGLAVKPYHSGRADDLSQVIAWGRSRFPNRRHVSIGFSLSGNALLLLVGGRPEFPQPDAAIAVNAPLNLAVAADLLDRGFNRVYQYRFVRDIMADIEERVAKGQIPAGPLLKRSDSLKRVDDLYTAPHSGFRDRHDYYARSSAGPHLEKIRVPTLLITAADDPFVDVQSYRDAPTNANVQIHIEPYGGHMGFLSAARDERGSRSWLDVALLAAVNQI